MQMQETKSDVRVYLENAPEYFVKLLAHETLRAVRRCMETPGNAEKLEELGRKYYEERERKRT